MAQDILMANDDLPSPTKSNTDTARNHLQQFCTKAKTATPGSQEILDLCVSVLEAPNVYVFAEFIAMPCVQELQNAGPNARYYNTLVLFAYGTYKQYRQEPAKYIELTSSMQKKLKHLTLVSLAIKTKSINYSVLLEELEIENVRHLEDVIIEAIYADIIHGKLFQNNRTLEIDYAQGRDIPPNCTSKIAKTLQDWVESCDVITNCIDVQIDRANAEKAKRLKNKAHIEAEFAKLKKVLKNQVLDNDDAMQVDSVDPSTSSSGQDVRKKPSKSRSVRLSSKSASSSSPPSTSADAGGSGSTSRNRSNRFQWFSSFKQELDDSGANKSAIESDRGSEGNDDDDDDDDDDM